MKNLVYCSLLIGVSLWAEASGTGPIAAKVAADFSTQGSTPVWHYAVPAMSEIQRLADAYPSDGTPNGKVRIIVAKDEYEPGSFLVWAQRNLGKVNFTVSDFRNEKGERFPNDALDLKVVKVWYQNRNGWFSYFADTGFKLCPELLLNDEDLIRVDTRKEANYARLVDGNGKTTGERWLNPPRQMDVRQLEAPWRRTDTFHNMHENFRDAATLQPVALPKGEFRQFFLTVHATKETPAGTYKGAVLLKGPGNQTIATVPVELRVLDFELPQPKCYLEPEKDFLVSSYAYVSFSHIAECNGWNHERARRQLVDVFKDMVAHNQTMHMIGAGFSKESFDTIEAMREAGMRMDVFQTANVMLSSKPEEMRAHAQIMADEFDRRYGHHNVYMGYGDEPPPRFFTEHRSLFEAYQSAGLKFFIAGDSTFSKAGYFYDWHNAARDATDDEPTRLWSRMKNGGRVAWYAMQHVGAENPALSRRQYGLGAWLTGYTALCNYAHHLGPYNDDSETYKPMVFAYGSGNGVIDTLQWEGFREGVDDIRYATLMTDFARKAQKSKDVNVRYLGGRAMQYLALVNPQASDLSSVRGEMIQFIEMLRPHVAPYAARSDFQIDPVAAKSSAERAETSLGKAVDAELQKLSSARGLVGTNQVHKAVAEVYRRYGRVEKEADYRKKFDLTAKPTVWDRIPEDVSLVNAEFDSEVFKWVKPSDTNGWRKALRVVFNDLGRNCHTYVAHEQPEAFLAVYRHLLPIASRWGVPVPSAVARNAVWASVQRKDWKGAADAARFGLKDPDAKPSDRYYLGLAVALERVSGQPDAYFRAAKSFNESVKDVPNEDRVAALCAYGSSLMNANVENAVRGLNDLRKSLYSPTPKKRYRVGFSETPIYGFSEWAKVSAEKQTYDRRFGGSMEFLQTDVTTGSRAVGNSGERIADPTMQVVADVNGLHFLVRFADPKAKEIALGLVDDCSFEGYIAPGANTPYACFTYMPRDGGVSFFNTTYPTLGGIRRLEHDGRKVRFLSEYAADETRHYFFFSWENWMQRVPAEGSVWDFENMCWHRSGNSCWNGTETIHGRSSWGELEFHLTDAQRAMVIKGLLVKALRVYENEKRTHADSDGALVHWQDPALGDSAFYAAQVKPLQDELDRYAKLITPDMTHETVFWLEKNALPRWQDIRFDVERRRAVWLQEKNCH